MASETLYLLMDDKGACMPTLYPTREAAQRAADTSANKWTPVPTEVPATPTPAAPQVTEAVVARAVDDALAAYRLAYTTDDLGNGLPLVDALTPDGDESVERGEYEIEELGLAIAEAVTAALSATPETGR